VKKPNDDAVAQDDALAHAHEAGLAELRALWEPL